MNEHSLNVIVNLISMVFFMGLYFFTEEWLAWAFALFTIGTKLDEILSQLKHKKRLDT